MQKKFLKLLIVFFTLEHVFLFSSPFTDWKEYPADPVFDPTYRAYYPSVLYSSTGFDGHGELWYYKMWYGTGDSIGIAYSNDGINWTDGGEVVNGGYHNVVLYDANQFGGGGFYYKMWYWYSSGDITSPDVIHYTESVDGVSWVHDQGITQDNSSNQTKIVTGISDHYFYHLYGPGCVIYNSSATATPGDPMSYPYVMYFDTATESSLMPGTGVEQIGLAYSNDGIFWTRYYIPDIFDNFGRPVLVPSGNMGQWDGIYNFRCTVLKLGVTYHMWYSGTNEASLDLLHETTIPTADIVNGIGHASSTDGITWVKDASNPSLNITQGVAWRDKRTYTPVALFDPNNFSCPTLHGDYVSLKLWFSGVDYTPNYAVGYATLDIPPTITLKVEREGMWFKTGNYLTWTVSSILPVNISHFAIYREDHKKWNLIKKVSGTTFSYLDKERDYKCEYQVIPIIGCHCED